MTSIISLIVIDRHCLSFKVYEIMETAPFGKRQKGEIGNNICDLELYNPNQDPTPSYSILYRVLFSL